jgi:putative phage-type endonuclease
MNLDQDQKVKSKKWLRKQVIKLREKPQPVQRSPEWFALRLNRITASEVASCLYENEYTLQKYIETFNAQHKYKKFDGKKGCNPYQDEFAFILNKCQLGAGFSNNPATLWGKKYEEIANNIYKRIRNCDVIEFGLLPHSRLSWLGASPDGITPDGVMLEIKCPSRRKIDNIPPFYYYAQVQIQLETCNLEECDFLQCELLEFDNEQDFLQQNNIQSEEVLNEKGILIEILVKNATSNDEPSFIYPPVNLIDPNEFIIWSDIELKKLEHDDTIVCKKLYYKLVKHTLVTIKRDREWFTAVRKDIKKVFDAVQKYRENDCFTLKEILRKQRHRDPAKCIINDDTDTEDEDDNLDNLEQFSNEKKCIIELDLD